MANVTITVDRNLIGQLLESAEARASQYDATARFYERGTAPDEGVLEVSDADEARDIAAFIRQAVTAVRTQL